MTLGEIAEFLDDHRGATLLAVIHGLDGIEHDEDKAELLMHLLIEAEEKGSEEAQDRAMDSIRTWLWPTVVRSKP